MVARAEMGQHGAGARGGGAAVLAGPRGRDDGANSSKRHKFTVVERPRLSSRAGARLGKNIKWCRRGADIIIERATAAVRRGRVHAREHEAEVLGRRGDVIPIELQFDESDTTTLRSSQPPPTPSAPSKPNSSTDCFIL